MLVIVVVVLQVDVVSFFWGIVVGAVSIVILVIYYMLSNPRRIEKKGKHLVKTDALTRQEVWIPAEDPEWPDGKFHGIIYRSRYTPSPAPYIILAHGMGGFHNDMHFEQICAGMAMAGYAVLGYDHRCHGLSTVGSFKKNGPSEFPKLFADILKVIAFVAAQPDVIPGRIGIVGFSLGGTVALCHPLNDPRVKVIVAGCAPHDMLAVFQKHAHSRPFSLPWLFSKMIQLQTHLKFSALPEFGEGISVKHYIQPGADYSKKVCLAHAKDDAIVPLEEFKQNVAALHLPPGNLLVFDQGNHPFDFMYAPLMVQLVSWLNQYL